MYSYIQRQKKDGNGESNDGDIDFCTMHQCLFLMIVDEYLKANHRHIVASLIENHFAEHEYVLLFS